MVGALSRAYYPINLHRANNLSVCSWVHIGPCAICMSLLNALAAMLCLAHPCSRYNNMVQEYWKKVMLHLLWESVLWSVDKAVKELVLAQWICVGGF